MQKSNSRILICLGVLVVLSGYAAASGIGVSPTKLEYEKVLKGGSAVKQFTIFNGGDKDAFYDLGVEGVPETWFTFDPATPVKVPAAGSVKVTATVSPPVDTANGVYNATIYIREASSVEGREGSAVMGITAGMGLRTSIDVTGEQILSGEVNKISVSDNEIGKPVRILMLFSNKGNVKAEPKMDVSITKDGQKVDSMEKVLENISPGSQANLKADWDTTNQKTGAYDADVKVVLGDKQITEQSVKFNVLERGALTVSGAMVTEGMIIPKESGVGELVKIVIPFRNTGEAGVEARLKAEVTLNGKLVDVLEGGPVYVDVGATQPLVVYFKEGTAGQYVVKLSIEYEGRTLDAGEKTIAVGKVDQTGTTKAEVAGLNDSSMWLIVIVAVVVVGAVVLFAVKRKK